MIYSNNLPISTRLNQQQNLSLLVDKEATNSHSNDKLLLPSSTRSLKRRISLLEKSRDWARRLITLHRPRRNTISNDKNREICHESNKKSGTNKYSSHKFLHNSQKDFDEDGYLSPLEIKAKIANITRENQSHSKLLTNPEQLHFNSNISQFIYRYHDPNIPTTTCQEQKRMPTTCQEQKRMPTTSFASEYQKSLSIVDYIDFDVPDDPSKQNDDPLESVKYLFTDNHKHQQGYLSRRIPRRATNVSSISTDSGYSDMPISSSSSSSSKLIPVHLISCTLIPVNVATHDPINTHCSTCTCGSSSSLSTTCLANCQERKFSSQPSRSYVFRQPLSYVNKTENKMNNQCTCTNKYYSTMTIYPSTIPMKSIMKPNDSKQEYHYQQQRCLANRQASLMRLRAATEDLTSLSRWYRPYLERDAVCDALQQADYGAFILRNSTTHPDCYALSLKVPKFTHDSNIIHYLIEKTIVNNSFSYRIKGTTKQFPTLLSLLTHHSVMPEILPITLNLNESFTA